MPELPIEVITAIRARLASAETTYEKGKTLEDYFCIVFQAIPGIQIAKRNVLNQFLTEEVDVALWNNKYAEGLIFLPNIILIECKNWSNPVGTEEVSYFKEKLESRGCQFGILITANGITGNPEDLSRAHSIIARALSQQIRIIVIKIDELFENEDSNRLVNLIKEKLLELTLIGTNR